MGWSEDQDMSAARGVLILNDTSTQPGSFDAIMVLEDTVFATIKTGGADVKDNYITTAATAVKAGALITAIGSTVFTEVSLTSGSVSLVL